MSYPMRTLKRILLATLALVATVGITIVSTTNWQKRSYEKARRAARAANPLSEPLLYQACLYAQALSVRSQIAFAPTELITNMSLGSVQGNELLNIWERHATPGQELEAERLGRSLYGSCPPVRGLLTAEQKEEQRAWARAELERPFYLRSCHAQQLSLAAHYGLALVIRNGYAPPSEIGKDANPDLRLFYGLVHPDFYDPILDYVEDEAASRLKGEELREAHPLNEWELNRQELAIWQLAREGKEHLIRTVGLTPEQVAAMVKDAKEHKAKG